MNPDHYAPKGRAGLTCLDAIDAVTAGKEGLQAFYAGNIVKYAYRYPHKGQALEDIDKIIHYAQMLREIVEAEMPAEPMLVQHQGKPEQKAPPQAKPAPTKPKQKRKRPTTHEDGSIKERILAHLRRSPLALSGREIADDLKENPSRLAARLSELHADGLVSRKGSGNPLDPYCYWAEMPGEVDA